MASFTLSAVDRFPVSTTVAVYPRTARHDSSGPVGAAVTSATVTAPGTVAFTGLADGVDYTAYALVSGQHRYVNFSTNAPAAGTGGRAWQPNTAYRAGDLVTQAGTLYRANADFTSGATFDVANWTAVATGGGAVSVQDEGSDLTVRAKLNFAGAGVTVTDDAGGGRSVITIPGGGGTGGLTPTAVKTTAYTAVAGDLVLADASAGAFIVTLPAAVAGLRVGVKRINGATNAVTVSRAGTALIDGQTTVVLDAQWATVTVTCNGTDWFIE